jgi:hypothetical protein
MHILLVFGGRHIAFVGVLNHQSQFRAHVEGDVLDENEADVDGKEEEESQLQSQLQPQPQVQPRIQLQLLQLDSTNDTNQTIQRDPASAANMHQYATTFTDWIWDCRVIPNHQRHYQYNHHHHHHHGSNKIGQQQQHHYLATAIGSDWVGTSTDRNLSVAPANRTSTPRSES